MNSDRKPPITAIEAAAVRPPESRGNLWRRAAAQLALRNAGHMTVQPIDPALPRRKHCPRCGVVVFEATPTKSALPAEKPWIIEGDCVHGLNYPWPDGARCAADTSLLLGRCWFCAGDYFVIQITLVPGGSSALVSWCAGSARPVRTEIKSCGLSQRLTANGLSIASWLRSEYETTSGVVHVHTIGPFELTDIAPGSSISLREERTGGTTWKVNAAMALVEALWPRLAADFVATIKASNRDPKTGLGGSPG